MRLLRTWSGEAGREGRQGRETSAAVPLLKKMDTLEGPAAMTDLIVDIVH